MYIAEIEKVPDCIPRGMWSGVFLCEGSTRQRLAYSNGKRRCTKGQYGQKMAEFAPLLRYFHSAYSLYASFKCLAGPQISSLLTLRPQPSKIRLFSRQTMEAYWTYCLKDNAENRRIYRAEAYCPLYTDARYIF